MLGTFSADAVVDQGCVAQSQTLGRSAEVVPAEVIAITNTYD